MPALFRRAGALLTALALAALLLAGCAAPAPAAGLAVPQGPPLDQRAALPPTAAEYEALLEEFTDACAVPGNSGRVEQLYRGLLDGFDAVACAAYLAQLAYDAAPGDATADGQMRANALYNDLSAQAVGCLQAALQSPHAAQVRRLLDGALDGWGGEAVPDRAFVLMERENALENQYTEAMARDVTALVDGEAWTDARLLAEGDALDDGAWQAVSLALSRRRNAEVGPLLLELAAVRRQLAAELGYESFTDYAYSALYARDYSPADAAALAAQVRRQVLPLTGAAGSEARDAAAWEALEAAGVRSDRELLARVDTAMQALDPELGRLFTYLRENRLYDFGAAGPGRSNSAYTVSLPPWRDAFIFYTRTGDYSDVFGLVHEFGHFAAFCQDPRPDLLAGTPLDVSEVQSQGLELLALHRADLLYPGAADSACYQEVLDLLLGISGACLVDAFEAALYQGGAPTLEQLNRLWASLQEEYGVYYFDDVDGVCYDWVALSHVFQDPLYYFSYGTAALSSLDLWTQAQRDFPAAMDTYKALLGSTQPYRAAMAACGLRDVFDPRGLEALAGDVRRECRRLGLL